MVSKIRLESDIIHWSKCPWCNSEKIEKKFITPDRSGSGDNFTLCTCRSCQFIFTQDVPGPSKISPYYQFEEYISHSDTQKGLTDKIYHIIRTYMLRRKYQIIRKHAKTDGHSILDYGSGTGYFLNLMKENRWKTQGVEIDVGARAYAIDKFKLNVQSPSSLDQVEGPFDVITLWHVLEHLYDFKEKIQFFHHQLKKNGLLVLALPNHTALDARMLKNDWAAYDTPRHLWHFNPKIIKDMAQKYRFSYVRSYGMPFDAFYVSILSYQIKRNNIFALIKGGLLGLLSNINSIFAPEKSSSLIYILRKI